MARTKEAKYKRAPTDKSVKLSGNPDSYLKLKPVWRFGDFDWDGPWGESTCLSHILSIRHHIEQHLKSFESMTWDEILKASGRKSVGRRNLHHLISVGGFCSTAQEKIEARGIKTDYIFSLRLDQCIRLYGLLTNECFSLLFLIPTIVTMTKRSLREHQSFASRWLSSCRESGTLLTPLLDPDLVASQHRPARSPSASAGLTSWP